MNGWLTIPAQSGAVSDHGENDPIPFDLGSWKPVAAKAREAIEQKTGRELTDVEAQP
jgi:hypothetical protein